jgi:hypothetical protein
VDPVGFGVDVVRIGAKASRSGGMGSTSTEQSRSRSGLRPVTETNTGPTDSVGSTRLDVGTAAARCGGKEGHQREGSRRRRRLVHDQWQLGFVARVSGTYLIPY